MAVHNGERFLAETLASVAVQTFADFEFLIVDDASTDNTPQILANFAASDERIVLLRNETNLGLTKSLNRGLAAARTPLIARMDSDDICEPQRLARQAAFLDANPTHLLVASSYRAIDEKGRTRYVKRKPATHDRIRWWFRFRMPIEHPSVMFRSHLPDQTPVRYDENYQLAQDYALFTKLSDHGKLAILPEVLFTYRVHAGNLTATRRNEQRANVLRIALSVQERDLSKEVREDLRPMMECYQLRERATVSALRKAVRAFDRMIAADAERGVAPEAWLRRHGAEILADAFLSRGRGFRSPAFTAAFVLEARRYLHPLVMRVLENKDLLPSRLETFPEDVAR